MNIKDSLAKLNSIDGFIGAALVDSDSGMLLGHEGGGSMNLEIAAAGNTEVVKSKRKTIQSLGLKESIEDILISLTKQYHLLRPLRSRPSLFFYVALDRTRANLAMARIALADVEQDLQVLPRQYGTSCPGVERGAGWGVNEPRSRGAEAEKGQWLRCTETASSSSMMTRTFEVGWRAIFARTASIRASRIVLGRGR